MCDGLALTGEFKLVRKATGYEKKPIPTSIGFTGYASRASRHHSTVSVTTLNPNDPQIKTMKPITMRIQPPAVLFTDYWSPSPIVIDPARVSLPRNRKAKRRSLPILGLRPNPAPLTLHNFLANRQTNSAARALRSVEAFERRKDSL